MLTQGDALGWLVLRRWRKARGVRALQSMSGFQVATLQHWLTGRRKSVSLRLQMLQVARLGGRELGESAELVRAFLRGRFSTDNGGVDRAGKADLYYTIFALAGLQALDEALPINRFEPWLRSFRDGKGLAFVHLSALARCWSALGIDKLNAATKDRLLARIENYRSSDGGYDSDPGSSAGNAYGCFVAYGAYQDLGREMPEPLRMVQCLKLLETPDGALANARKLLIR